MRSKATRQHVKRFIVACLTLAFAFCAGSSLVMAGGTPPAESIAIDQSIAQAVVAYPAPPAKFRPLSASAAQLEDYGFPPRPDPFRAPRAYAHWKKLVSVPRAANPNLLLQQTRIYNGPPQHLLSGRILRNGIVPAGSINWSGYAVVAAGGTFTSNNSAVFAEWVVPRARQAVGVCDGSWDYSSQWGGFDGVTSNDVLQAGTEADAYCSGSTQFTFYSSWIEWFPFAETRVSIPAIRPGDLMIATVWFTTTPPFGHAYLANYTLYQAAVYAFNPPAGTTFAGDSVEWVVERPSVDSSLANLTNYVADPFNFASAINSNSFFSPGSSPAGTTTYAFTMSCPPWNPSSSCPSTTAISTPSLYGYGTLWFYDSGPAF
jgi:hypothetical protein